MSEKITYSDWRIFLEKFMGKPFGNGVYDYFLLHFGIDDEMLKLTQYDIFEYIADKYVEFPDPLYGN